MTNSDRWRVIAEAFDTPPWERDNVERALTQEGLCFAWKQLTRSSRAYRDIGRTLWREHQRDYLAKRRTREGDAIRATLAGLLAAMTERERRALWREAGR